MTQKCLGFEAFPGLGRTLAALWFRSAALSFPIHEGEGSTTCRDCPGRVGKTLLRVQPRARGPSLRWPRALVLGESRLVLLAVTQARGKSPPDPTPSTSEELTLPGFECPRVTGRAGWGRGPAVPVCSWACRCGPPHTHTPSTSCGEELSPHCGSHFLEPPAVPGLQEGRAATCTDAAAHALGVRGEGFVLCPGFRVRFHEPWRHTE